MTAHPRPFRGLVVGDADDGLVIAEFANSAIRLLSAPTWRSEPLLARRELLGPGVYVVVGGDDGEERLSAYVGESGCLYERLASHVKDDGFEFAWHILAVSGARVMSDTVRLAVQRRLVDELTLHGRTRIRNAQDADRHSAGDVDAAVAEGIVDELRFLIGFVLTPLIPPVRSPDVAAGARAPIPPADVDEAGRAWTLMRMRHRGAEAHALMRGREVVLLEGSTVVAQTRARPAWLGRRRSELAGAGAIAAEGAFMRVRTPIRFATVHHATSFVIGGGTGSARLLWVPVDTH